MQNTDLPRKVRISDEVLFQEIEGECVLLNLATEKYFGLNEVGSRLWHLLAEDGTTERAVSLLHEEYDVDADSLRRDLAGLIREMNEQGLVTVEN